MRENQISQASTPPPVLCKSIEEDFAGIIKRIFFDSFVVN